MVGRCRSVQAYRHGCLADVSMHLANVLWCFELEGVGAVDIIRHFLHPRKLVHLPPRVSATIRRGIKKSLYKRGGRSIVYFVFGSAIIFLQHQLNTKSKRFTKVGRVSHTHSAATVFERGEVNAVFKFYFHFHFLVLV